MQIVKLKYQLFFILFIGLFSGSAISTLDAQVVLYLELMKEEKPIKYYAGQALSVKTTDYPDEWTNIRIERILDDEKIILYNGGMIKLQDITQIRRSRDWAKIAGYMLQTFGVAWLGYGGVAHFTTDFDFGTDTAVIGGTAIVSGWLIQKFFKFKNYKIGKKNRLKILDLSWPEPRG